MWNNKFRVLWVKIHITENRHIYLNLPISLYAFVELTECVMDLLTLACFFTPKDWRPSPYSVPLYAVKELMQSVIKVFESLTFEEAYDLVEVEAQNVKVSIKIR